MIGHEWADEQEARVYALCTRYTDLCIARDHLPGSVPTDRHVEVHSDLAAVASELAARGRRIGVEDVSLWTAAAADHQAAARRYRAMLAARADVNAAMYPGAIAADTGDVYELTRHLHRLLRVGPSWGGPPSDDPEFAYYLGCLIDSDSIFAARAVLNAHPEVIEAAYDEVADNEESPPPAAAPGALGLNGVARQAPAVAAGSEVRGQ